MKPVEVAAMREVCRVRGWEIPSEFSLNPPNSPAVLIHWRALIELLGLMPAPRRVALWNTAEYFEVGVGACSAVYAAGVSHPGLGGIGPDAGQSPQHPAKYSSPLLQWG